MNTTDKKENWFEGSVPESSKKSGKDIIREILDYSSQKYAYMGEHYEGPYLIAYIVERARWFQYLENDQEVNEEPKNENAFIGIAVHDVSDFHFVKDLKMSVTVTDEKGDLIGKQQHFYHPRPGLHNYGRNWILPGDGHYTIRVEIDPPDPKNGEVPLEKRSRVVVYFQNVMIHTGHQIS